MENLTGLFAKPKNPRLGFWVIGFLGFWAGFSKACVFEFLGFCYIFSIFSVFSPIYPNFH
jgi:hypothetical protein